MKKIVLIGGGGHCKSVIDTLKKYDEYKIIGITDPKMMGEVLGIKILGTDEILKKIYDEGVRYAFITVGSVGDSTLRVKLYNMAKKIGYEFPTIIDKSSIVSKGALLEDGVFVGKGAIVNVDAKIGKQSIINSGSIIEHDCCIGSFVHVAPGAVLSGNVSIGDNSHVGTNATIIEGINICNNTLIGAGTVVIKSIDKPSKVYGNPGRVR